MVVFGSCGVGRAAAKRQVLPGGLRAEVLDAPHGSQMACRTALASVGGSFEGCAEVRRWDDVVAGGVRNQQATQRQFFLTGTIGEKAVVANADEASGQDVLQETTQKLHRSECHHAVAIAMSIVLIAKAHRVGICRRDP